MFNIYLARLCTNPEQVFNYLRTLIGFEEKEVFAVMFLDNQHRLIKGKVMFTGTINSASVHPREIVKEALLCNAARIIISHNHPSGYLEPSQSDISLTRKIQAACQLVDIGVLDHLIISANGYYSMRYMLDMEV